MNRLLLVLLILALFPNYLFAQDVGTDKKVDEILVKYVDFFGNGAPCGISLHLSAEKMASPFSWTLSIVCQGKKTLSHKSNDEGIDKFFNDEGYVEGCQDYLSCKNKYYYDDILDGVLLTGKNWYDANAILNKSNKNKFFSSGRLQLSKCCHVTSKAADAMLKKLEQRLRMGTAIGVNIPVSPVQSKSPLIFVPEVGHFISIYEE